MYELKVTVKKVMGNCTGDPPLKPGDFFTVSDGDIRIPQGGQICLWALQNLMTLLTPKEREITEKQDEDWMWRVHHAQCPDPQGRVIFKIERTGKVDQAAKTRRGRVANQKRAGSSVPQVAPYTDPNTSDSCHKGDASETCPAGPQPVRIVVQEVRGKCTSGMMPGDCFKLNSGRLHLAPDRPVCLYALQSVIALLPSKRRAARDDDWLDENCRVICPDPAGNVILRIDRCEK